MKSDLVIHPRDDDWFYRNAYSEGKETITTNDPDTDEGRRLLKEALEESNEK